MAIINNEKQGTKGNRKITVRFDTTIKTNDKAIPGYRLSSLTKINELAKEKMAVEERTPFGRGRGSAISTPKLVAALTPEEVAAIVKRQPSPTRFFGVLRSSLGPPPVVKISNEIETPRTTNV